MLGCAVFVLKQLKRSKFAPRALEGVLLEVIEHGVYNVLVNDENPKYSIIELRHVTFDD